jgi:hypothetical protein
MCSLVQDVIFDLANFTVCSSDWPPLWSSGQSFWLQIQRSRVRFPALPHFLSSSGSGMGSTQPRELNWGATWIKKVAAPVQKTEINGRGDPLRWPRYTPSIRKKLALTSPTGGGRSVGIVRSRTKCVFRSQVPTQLELDSGLPTTCAHILYLPACTYQCSWGWMELTSETCRADYGTINT